MIERGALFLGTIFCASGQAVAYTSYEFLKDSGVKYTIKPGETITIDATKHNEFLESANSAFDTGFYLLLASGALFLLASYVTRDQP